MFALLGEETTLPKHDGSVHAIGSVTRIQCNVTSLASIRMIQFPRAHPIPTPRAARKNPANVCHATGGVMLVDPLFSDSIACPGMAAGCGGGRTSQYQMAMPPTGDGTGRFCPRPKGRPTKVRSKHSRIVRRLADGADSFSRAPLAFAWACEQSHRLLIAGPGPLRPLPFGLFFLLPGHPRLRRESIMQ
jgi:hypothetical protein